MREKGRGTRSLSAVPLTPRPCVGGIAVADAEGNKNSLRASSACRGFMRSVRMPRPTNETSREPAARATPARRDRVADADRQDEERNRITDEGLGLSPGRAPSEGERRGSGLAEPADAMPDFEPMGQQTGPLGDAARPTGRAEVVDEESDLTTTPHTLDGADRAYVDADVEPSLVDQPLLTDPIAAVGAPDDTADPAAAGDEVYVPPTDPVVGPGRHGDVTV